MSMLNLERPKYLALDRTNWKLGSRDINILVLAIVTRRFRVPLLFTLLPHQGDSDTGHRIALMRRNLSLFPAASIRGCSPIASSSAPNGFLNENNPLRHPHEGRHDPHPQRRSRVVARRALAAQASSMRNHRRARQRHDRHHARTSSSCRQTRLGNGEWLIVATNRPDPKQVLNDYRKRMLVR
ncbi:hypothetical protein NKH60_33235 [Mesorhizobium sp. M1006]|uniref:hypothetical protein n=1 Tax=Mesorhizobium sp. M1006 TaxID=2957048 RepID=UPI003338E8A5